MGITFLKRGKEAQEAHVKADVEAEIRSKQRGPRRFWVPKDGESIITFLDGALTPEGLLDVVSYNEHRKFLNGSWRNYFPCVAAQEPCPICQEDNQATLVTLFTVIDHTKWKDRNGKTHQNERKLFVAKRDTVKRLQKMAAKRGGLIGWRVSIGRVGDRSPEVGTDFDFVEKVDLKAMGKELKLKPDDLKPFDYDTVVPYFTADELRELGFGPHVVGQHDAPKLKKAVKKPAKAKDDDDDDDDVVDDDDSVFDDDGDDDDDDDM